MSLFKNKKNEEAKKNNKPIQKNSGPAVSSFSKITAEYKAGDILKRVWVSEKATGLQTRNQYVFLVDVDANKPSVKDAVRERYGAKVQTVNMTRIKGKTKYTRGRVSKRPDFKKAIVTLRPGEKMEIN